MSPLRRRMIEDMQIRNLTLNTQRVYVEQVVRFAGHFRKSPDHLGPPEIRTYLLHLANQKRLAAQFDHCHSLRLTVFLYRHAQVSQGCRRRHPCWQASEEAAGGDEPELRGGALPGCRGQSEAPRDPHRLLRDGPADFRGCPTHHRRHRQPAHGHPGRAGQRPQRPLCHAAAQTPRYAQGLLAAHPPRTVAIPR